MSEDSIFSKIIRGEVPAHKLYEDDQVRIWDQRLESGVGRGKTWVVPKGAVERAKNSGSVGYRAILIEFKDT